MYSHTPWQTRVGGRDLVNQDFLATRKDRGEQRRVHPRPEKWSPYRYLVLRSFPPSAPTSNSARSISLSVLLRAVVGPSKLLRSCVIPSSAGSRPNADPHEADAAASNVYAKAATTLAVSASIPWQTGARCRAPQKGQIWNFKINLRNIELSLSTEWFT